MEALFLKHPAAIAKGDGEPSRVLEGQSIAFVGKLGGANRQEVSRIVADYGGTIVEGPVNDKAVDMIVVGDNELPGNEPFERIGMAAQAKVKNGESRLLSESQFWQELGFFDDDDDIQSLYTPAMLAQLAGVPLTTIRRWRRRGLIEPKQLVMKLPYYDYQEVVNTRHLAGLIASGRSEKVIEDKLGQLKDFCKKLGRPISQLSVIIDGRNVLFRDEQGLVEPDGQKRIDFGALDQQAPAEDPKPRFLSLGETRQAAEQLTTPDQYLTLAMELEDLGETEQAIEVYRTMGLAFGPSAETCFQLAELFYFNHQYDAARERYYMAIELDETFVEARANLGCVLLEQGQVQLAIEAFRGALKHHKAYPDVHFHLARALDQIGNEMEATFHWEKFMELSPHSPWAQEARERLSQT